MRNVVTWVSLACAMWMVVAMAAFPAGAQSNFTYQGRLDVEGEPYTGPAWLRFTLWNAADGGLPITAPVVVSNTYVKDGLFTVDLDYGVDVLRQDSYMQMDVRTTPTGVFVPIAPRQAMKGAPIATYARNAAGWSIVDGPVMPYTIVRGSSAMIGVDFAAGSTVTQSFISPVSGSMRSISMYLGGVNGPADVIVSIERAQGAIATKQLTVGGFGLATVPFDIPAEIVNGEQLRLVVQTLSGTSEVGITVFTRDVYTLGNSSYVDPLYPTLFTDVTLSLNVAQPVSTGANLTRLTGGWLVMDNPRGSSIIQISDGPTPDLSFLEFLRGSTRGVVIGKDAAGSFVLDVGTTRAMTATPSGAITMPGNVEVQGTLSAMGLAQMQTLEVDGPATLAGATFGGAAVFNGATTMAGTTSMLGATSVGAITGPSSLGVFGSVEVNTGSLTASPTVAFRVNHGNPTISGWPIRIDNPAVSGFSGGVRLSGAGFVEVTNRAGSGLATGFARLDSAGAWTAVSDARLKTAIEEASSEGLLAAALKVRPVTYFFRNEEARADDVPHVGVLAQELREVLPDLVHDDGTYMTVNYAQMSVVAIGAIQAQQERMEAQRAMIDSQHATIDAQQREIEALRARLEAIERAIGGGKDMGGKD